MPVSGLGPGNSYGSYLSKPGQLIGLRQGRWLISIDTILDTQ